MIAKVSVFMCLFGLAFAGHLYGGHGYSHGLGYSSYNVAPAVYSAYSAPVVKTIAPVYTAPVAYSAPVVKSYAPVSYSAPIVKTVAPVSYAPAVSYAAPAVSYAAPAVSYSAPAVSYVKSYATPAVSYVKSYAAPVSYSSYPVSHGYSGLGYGSGYGSKYLW